jgi:nucleotide-binding universal stress UspA family protein
MEHRRHTGFQKILVGYDGSEQAEKAVDAAITLARCLDSYVLALAVARPPEPPTAVELEAALDDAREHFELGLKRAIAHAQNQGVTLESDFAVGHPGEQLIHRAEQDHFDLIIVGRRGTSLFQKMILGSTSERVLRYAHCPVMVVK